MPEDNQKWCPYHKCYHSIKKFGVNRGRGDGLQSWCKDALREYNRMISDKNKVKWSKSDPHNPEG